MKRLLSSFFLMALCGCASPRLHLVGAPSRVPYSKVTSSDFEGHLIAEFIAEGSVHRTQDGNGFRFTAVQRRIFQPGTLEFHYPLGRPVAVIASNVVVTPVAKPLWLDQMDHTGQPIQPTIQTVRR